MQTITIELNNTHSVGLGDNLCLLSALALLPPKVILCTNNDHKTFERLSSYSKILRISKDQLEVQQINHNGTFDNTGWPVKIFTDYYRTSSVNVNGNLIQIHKRTNKKYIGLVTAFEEDRLGQNEWPWCRNRPLEYWAKIFAWIKSIGYEVITLDDAYFSLENKIEIMAKHCQAIISYEGGMAHLAHTMDIPCFVLDWKHPSPSTALNVFHVDFVHRSNSVYILRNDEEILSWDRLTFDITVEKLRDGNGNNRLVSKEFYFNFVGPNFQNDLRIYNKNHLLCLQTPSIFGRNYADFLFGFYQNSLTQ